MSNIAEGWMKVSLPLEVGKPVAWYTRLMPWRALYCTLHSATQEIRMYRSMTPSEIGAIALDEVSSIPVCLIHTVSASCESWSGGCGFEIVYSRFGSAEFPSAYLGSSSMGSDRKRFKSCFKAPSPASRLQWMSHINDLVETLRAARRASDGKSLAAELDVERVKRGIEESMRQVVPRLEEAGRALSALTLVQIIELKSLEDPPECIVNVLKAVGLILAGQVGIGSDGFVASGVRANQLTWSQVKGMLQHRETFMELLQSIRLKVDRNALPDTNFDNIRVLLSSPAFSPARIAPVNEAAAALCAWVLAMTGYYDLHCELRAQQRDLLEASKRLENAERDVLVHNSIVGQRSLDLLPGGAGRLELEADMKARLKALTPSQQREIHRRATSITMDPREIRRYLSHKPRTPPKPASPMLRPATPPKPSHLQPDSRDTDEEEGERESLATVRSGSPVRTSRMADAVETLRTKLSTASLARLTPSQILQSYSSSRDLSLTDTGSIVSTPRSPRGKRMSRVDRIASAMRNSPTHRGETAEDKGSTRSRTGSDVASILSKRPKHRYAEDEEPALAGARLRLTIPPPIDLDEADTPLSPTA